MLVRLLLIIILIVISLFCWISFLNPLDVEFDFFGKIISTNLSTLMISSFVLGIMLVFISTLARDAKRAIEGYQKSRQVKKGQLLKEELNKGMDHFLRGNIAKAKTHFTEVLKRDPSQIDLYFRLSEIALKEGNDEEALHWLLAEIYLHKKDFSKAAQEFEKTFELSGTSYLPYICTTCRRGSKEWMAYCPQCHQWGTYTISENDKIFDLPSSEQLQLPFRLDAMKIPL